MKKTLILSLALLFPVTSMIHANPQNNDAKFAIGLAIAGRASLYGLYKVGQGIRSNNKHVRATSKGISAALCAGASAITACGFNAVLTDRELNNKNFAFGFGAASIISSLCAFLFTESAIRDII